MKKTKLSIHGTNIINKLISKKTFLDSFEIEDKLLWESPISTEMCNYKFSPNSEYLLLDLYAISYKLGLLEKRFYTLNSTFLDSEYYRLNKEAIQVYLFKDILKIDWKVLLNYYIDNILSFFDSDHIILIKSEKSEYVVTNYQCRLKQQSFREFNTNLELIEDYFVQATHCKVIDLCKKYFEKYVESAGSVNLNYEDEFYEDVIQLLKKNRSSRQKIFNTPDYRYVLERYVKYYDHMLRSNLQKLLLDDQNFIDHIVLNLGKNLINTYKKEIIILKNNNYQKFESLFKDFDFSECQELKKAIRCVEAIDNENFAVPNFDYSVIFNRDMRLKLLMIPRVRKKLKTENILGDIEVSPYNVDICFEYLNLFLRKQYRKCVEILLKNTDKLYVPIDVDVWGSCISREIYNSTSGKIKIKNYFYRCCCLHAFNAPVQIDKKLFEQVDIFGGAWRRNGIQIEMLREAKDILEQNSSNWIVLDFYDLIEECFSLKGEPFILDVFGRNSKFFSHIKKDIKRYSYLKEKDEVIKSKMDSFIVFLKMKYGDRIILNRHFRQYRYITTENKIKDMSFYDVALMNKQNFFIRKWEQYFIDNTNCYSIDIAKKFLGDDSFVWGVSPVHYENCFFEESIKIIEEIIESHPLQKHYNSYSYKTRIDRILRLLPQNKDSLILEQLFNDNYMDKIVLHMDYGYIEKYRQVLEEIYLSNFNNSIEMMNNFNFKGYESLYEHIQKICHLNLFGETL